jgi:general secretion pathway protein G
MKRCFCFFAWFLVLLLTCTGVSLPSMAKDAATSSTAPASGPAQKDDPKSVMERFFKKGFEGDEQAVLEMMFLPDEGSRTAATVFLKVSLSEILWNRALACAFSDQYKPAPDPTFGRFDNSLASAKVTVSGDTARVMTDIDTLVLIRDKGVWKVNLPETIKTMSPQEQKELKNPGPEFTAWAQMIADVKAGKFKTAHEAHAELVRRLTTAGAAPKMIEDLSLKETWYTSEAIGLALASFREDVERFPTAAEGLGVLVKRPSGEGSDKWKGPYISAIPQDGWGRPFSYISPSKIIPRFDQKLAAFSYDLTSPGPDGKLGTDDDSNRSMMGHK